MRINDSQRRFRINFNEPAIFSTPCGIISQNCLRYSHLPTHPPCERGIKLISSLWSQTAGRFMRDLEDMLGFKPFPFLYYMWCYVTPAILAILTVTTLVQMAMSPAGYSAWVASEVSACRCPALESSASVLTLLPPSLFFRLWSVSRATLRGRRPWPASSSSWPSCRFRLSSFSDTSISLLRFLANFWCAIEARELQCA